VDNLSWGLSMTAVGMGLVFSMLALLWGLLTLVLRLDRPAEASAPPDAAGPAPADETPGETPDDTIAPEVIAAITIATLAHVSARRREAAPLMRSVWPGSLLYASRWVTNGRARQNQTWQRRGG
jgi:glutaconyl-CoA/methylmalonyl-CoA decarboxylase subunit delta